MEESHATNILSSFEEIKNYVDTGEPINRVTEFPKPLMRFFAFFTSKVLHESMAGEDGRSLRLITAKV